MASSASRGNSKSPPSNLKVSERPLTLIKTIGKKGSGDGQFDNPTSLAVTTEGDIVVADRNNKRLQFLSKDGSFKKKVDLEFEPQCVAVQPNGELLVTGDINRIHVLDKQGREARVIRAANKTVIGGITEGIAVDGSGRIIVTIRYQVIVLSPSGDVEQTLEGQDRQQLDQSLRVAVNSSNQIIVSDLNNNNVKIFDPAGRYLFTCGSRGSGPGQLNNPYCVITDSEDNIIVADYNNHRVSLFSRDGTFIRHVLIREEHGLKYSFGLALTNDGHLVVSGNDCVKMFSLK